MQEDGMRRLLIISLTGFIIAGLAPLAGAVTIAVPGDQPSIGAGLAAAVAGDSVLVDCGVYQESDLVLKSGVALISATSGAYCATIDAAGLGRVFLAEGVDNQARVQGFTLRGGSVGSGLAGGGIHLSASSPVFENCIIIDNETADTSGGGLACVAGSGPIFERCSIAWNRSGDGGGGAYLEDSDPTFIDCLVFSNDADASGGGIQAEGSSFLMQHSDVYENSAGSMGGGVYLGQSSAADWALVTVFGNRATSSGGGVAIDASSPTFTGCTLAENSAFTAGAGILVSGASAAVFDKVIVAYNTLTEAVTVTGGSATFECSDIFGNLAGNWTAPIDGQLGQTGNLSANPEFCGVDSSGNYYLQMDSPCAPSNNGCSSLIGSRIIDCGFISVDPTSWSSVKSYY
jgi:hypothetical protein